MHYYQHHIGDFIRDTANLSDSQSMAYLRLIWMYYDTEKPLPDNSRLLAFKLGSEPETIELLLEAFFKKEGDFWRHTRIESEILSYKEKGEKARDSANKRWNRSQCNADAMRSQCDGNANAMPSQGSSSKVDANQEPITNNQEIKEKNSSSSKRKTSLAEDFVPPPNWMAKATDYGMTDLTFRNEIGKFKNHHGEKGTTSSDWLRQWDTWCRQWVGYGARQVQLGGHSPPLRTVEPIRQARQVWS